MATRPVSNHVEESWLGVGGSLIAHEKHKTLKKLTLPSMLLVLMILLVLPRRGEKSSGES